MKISLLLSAFLFFSATAMAQAPPAVAMPDKSNVVLIDSLMRITGYKEYFIAYCDRQIDLASKKNNWDEDVIRKKKLSVSFNDFKEYTVYNWFSSLGKKELLELIGLFRKLNEGKYSSFMVTHPGIQSNLELFVKRYLE